MNRCYDDILFLPHHVSERHPHMPLRTRAGQFAPFAALTGYEAVIQETRRLTEPQIELDECAKSDLDIRLRLLMDALSQRPEVSVTYFVPDEKKTGGAYCTATGRVQTLDLYQKCMVMGDGTAIPIEAILKLQGDCFCEWDDVFPLP